MSANRETRQQSILHAYLQAIDRGEKPDRQAILDANPKLQDDDLLTSERLLSCLDLSTYF